MKKALLAGIGAMMLISTLSMPAASAAQTAGYSNAVKNGDALAAKTRAFRQAIGTKQMTAINSQYNAFTSSLKSTEASIGKVSGASNRNALLKKYVAPAKIELERTIYEVSQYRLLQSMESKNLQASYTIDSDLSKLDRLKKRAAQIKESGGYPALDPAIGYYLRKKEAIAEGAYTMTYVDAYKILVNKDRNIYYANNMYDYLSRHIKETEKRIGQVSGSSARADLQKTYVQPGKKEIERTIYYISRHRLMNSLFALAQSGKKEEAKAQLPELDRLKEKAERIVQEGGYEPVPAEIKNNLDEDEQQLRELIDGK
ncbi:hypothetical protein CEF21_21180 [Bacillus sp. FJAT-42376]|uniref:hypothetical protein n=1 Tax=Bacillus sp. FJAT-42376 TaxID=2014076 RepID=UPI000F505A45|nr:hypothetical protein [Bacillus sp. FJAT-42376]AZB44595.1 hypothetical protein CEF21_21180 [Bacillus sp. FJAT-42376]